MVLTRPTATDIASAVRRSTLCERYRPFNQRVIDVQAVLNAVARWTVAISCGRTKDCAIGTALETVAFVSGMLQSQDMTNLDKTGLIKMKTVH